MIFFNTFSDPKETFVVISRIAALSSILASLEWLSLYKHFRPNGIFSWEIHKIWAKKNRDRLALSFNFIFKYPNILFVIFTQLIVALIILFKQQSDLSIAISMGYLAFTYFLITYRGVNGFNGADSTSKIVFTILTLCFAVSSTWVFQVGLFFITFQLILAYFTPGFLRLVKKNWWNGRYLRNILRLETFGNKRLWEFCDRYTVTYKIISWLLILFECSVIIIIFVPLPWLIVWLCCALLFHIINAVVMGLNNFPLAFLALYPAIIWLNIRIHSDIEVISKCFALF
ncbi:hypothetical protein M9Q43_05570 [Flavobacterium sp. HXWNR29]|uniref:hypothetical protein n=1 Tax=Flavobacterium odoriferum TaxID=2946604 RepID=UPI0021CB4FBB|nr:hypothetical protein [Flavobacterium sp. HXWNR29]MCU4188632.1 hypothetical protein [Flavobacterium sp. HXWNR29]